jgi:hypothetical protein
MPTSSTAPLDLGTLRTLVQEAGYLPLSNKANRLLDELIAMQKSGFVIAGVSGVDLRKSIDELGYLPLSKALRLLDAVEAGRQAS